MITTDPAQYLQAFRGRPAAGRGVLRAALLVSPAGFAVNLEAAADNRYVQRDESIDTERALAQHADVVRVLGELGVPVLLFPGRDGLPDGIYANNVFATACGKLIVGSMRHPSRRREAARQDIRSVFRDVLRYEIEDLSARDCVAELTGPLVIDRARNIGLCGLSERVDDAGVRAMHEAFGLDVTYCFELAPSEYHTNIVLAVLAGRACVIHPPSLADSAAAQAIATAYGDACITLSDEEKEGFAGNCIAVTREYVLLSEAARRSLRPETAAAFARAGFGVRAVAIDELEKGGGSLRCLIAEVY